MESRPIIYRLSLLRATGIAALAGVTLFGLMNAPQAQAQSGQTAGAPPPSFEVASVKPSRSGENTSFHVAPNGLTVRSEPVDLLIKFAYGHDFGEFGFRNLRDSELVGGPSWARPRGFGYEGYDVEAKVDDSLAEKFGKDCGRAFFRGSCSYRQPILLMLQSLLADRFKLKVRRETKEGPVYALVVAKGGPKFLHTTFELEGSGTGAQKSNLRPPHPAPCPPGLACVQVYASMGRLADWLSQAPEVGRPVVDQTGLQGGYYIKIQHARGLALNAGAPTGTVSPPGPAGPSIFTALQKQLGLRLKPTKGPVQVLVVDHIERPTPN